MKKHRFQIPALILAAIIVGILSSTLVFVLKEATEFIEHEFRSASQRSIFLIILFPLIGLTIIYSIRKALFKNRENRGIREITESFKSHSAILPAYKIPSHFLNGFFTIIFGGSTGIEVSSVVAASTIGSVYTVKTNTLIRFKKEIICAGAAAAITMLFNSPLAGIFFAYEVLYRKISWPFVLATFISSLTAWAFNLVAGAEPLFHIDIQEWHYHGLPYFILLGILAGFHSVYLTKMVLWLKTLLNSIPEKLWRILIGGLLVGIAIYFLPSIYGEGYASMQQLLEGSPDQSNISMLIIQFLLILLIKPICTSLTLAAGGDGGVFAPSLFIGAFLGGLLALVLNHWFHANIIPVNFMIVGMASVLCASIQAPVTSIFLVCGITGNYVLIVPLIIGCALSRITAHFIFPYSVYNVPLKKK
jgi:CIC family chloride channel protein